MHFISYYILSSFVTNISPLFFFLISNRCIIATKKYYKKVLQKGISPLLFRCCDYALLILEYWADAPEIQRSADLYEDLIRCCVADAISEVYLSFS